MRSLFSAVSFVVLFVTCSALGATPTRTYEVGETVSAKMFPVSTCKKYELHSYASNPLPPGLNFAADAAGAIWATGSPTTAGTYTTAGYGIDRATQAQVAWQVLFIITQPATQTTGTFAMTESAKEGKTTTTIVAGKTKITATIALPGQEFSPSDRLVLNVNDVQFFDKDLSSIGFDGAKASFVTDDGAKVSVRVSRGTMKITVSRAFYDSLVTDNLAVTPGVVAGEMISDATGTQYDNMDVVIMAGLKRAKMTPTYTARVSTKDYTGGDQASSVSVKAQGQ